MQESAKLLEDLLTRDEVCNTLKISPAKFYRLVTSGRLPAVKIGSTWRVRPSVLRNWIDEQSARNNVTPAPGLTSP